jgi:hypothetical protein
MRDRTKTKSTILMLGAGVASLLGAADAGASGWRHFPPSLCAAMDNGSVPPAINTYGQAYNTRTGDTVHAESKWLCPVVTDSTFPGSTATFVQVWGYNAYFDGLAAQECRTYYWGGGGVCGAGANASDSIGVYSMQWKPGSAWSDADPADSLYVLVYIGPGLNGSYPVVFGYGFSW